jgi:rhamnulokinase
VPAGTVLGKLQGPLSELEAFRETVLIAPACHDTASAIAGIVTDMTSAAYICSGTWSLVGTLASAPVTTQAAFDARYTNLGSATEKLCFHTGVNGMWILKQCMDAWSAEGRPWGIEELIAQAAKATAPGVIDVDAEPLMLDSNMPERLNHELWKSKLEPIPDVAGNEPIFARLIFESLAARYASALTSLEGMLGRKLERIHILGGASRNKLLCELTAQRTGLPVETGETEGSTIGNLAVQLAAAEADGKPLTNELVRKWATRLCK